MSDAMKLTLLRVAMILVTIAGAVYVFLAINNAREGNVDFLQLTIAVLIVLALIRLNRWWFRKSGTRL
jgi:heme/copper-type cytochrome/quinol oxidase subunit 4